MSTIQKEHRTIWYDETGYDHWDEVPLPEEDEAEPIDPEEDYEYPEDQDEDYPWSEEDEPVDQEDDYPEDD